MATPDPTEVAPWYLRNINQALALDEATGNVYVRTGFEGNIIISGNVVIPGNVDCHISEIGTSGNLTVPWMPVSIDGNSAVTVTSGNITVAQGTDPWNVAGNVGISGTVTTVPDLSVGDFFGEPYSIPITPVVQLDGRYGINTKDVQTYTAGGGNTTTSGSCYQVSSTSTLGSYGLLRSKRFNTFKPGQSFIARWYGKFSTPTAGTSQRMGLNNQENAYWFGYNNTTFGFLHVHGGRAPIYRITVASYTGAQNVTVTLNGVAYVIAISAGLTTGQVAQQISQSAFGGLWLANQRDNTVELLYTAVGALGGTFSISGSGTFSGSIAQVQAGAAATNEWLYDGTDFDLPAWYNPEQFNQYEMKYSWAGVSLFILNTTTGQYQLVFQHLHAEDTLLLTNPAFKVGILALNQGGSTAVTVTVASMMSGLEGITNRNNYTAGVTDTATSLSQNTLYQILSIQNPYTFNGTINTKELLLQDLSVATQCNDPCQIYVFVETIVNLATGVDDYVSRDGLPATVSYENGTITQNQYYPVATFVVGNTGSVTQFDLSQYRVVVPPGSQATVAILSTAVIQKATSSIVWYND
jgi:hypothetical protein